MGFLTLTILLVVGGVVILGTRINNKKQQKQHNKDLNKEKQMQENYIDNQ
tara:strand:- start:539 stop:688 length:150 start_codon:yes stop_codon:yes gene_type:complete